VLGTFVSAQLFTKSTGGYTLVVTRPDGAFDRYDLSGESAEGLRGLIATALASGQRAGVGEQTSVASDPAGNAFVRNQALLGLFLYGPSAAALVGGASNNGSTGLGAELIVATGTFAAALARRNATPAVTTAQNRLSTHAAIHGAALGEALLYTFGVDENGDGSTTHGAALLAGSITGTVLGMRAARTMTDAEAASSAFGADFVGGATAGVIGMAGLFDGRTSRPALGALSAAVIGGYLLGPSYPRRAAYTVTAGDVRAMALGAAIGVGAAATPFIDRQHVDGHVAAGVLTAGLLAGALAGDRWLVRPRDHTTSEATLLWTGAGVGLFVGGGVAVIGSAGPQPAWGLGVAGALLGAVATEAAVHPRPGGRRILSSRSGEQSAAASAASDDGIAHEVNARRTQITFDPIGAVFAATSRIGTFSVLRVSF
jgi:hypothetical protein